MPEFKRAGLPSQASGKPHVNMLYDERVIQEHEIEPIRWTASRFVLVLSHVGTTRHDKLAFWPLAG